MHATGNQKISRPLGSGFGEDGGFNLQKALVAEVVTDGLRDVVAQAEVVLHLRAAQVHVAVLEANLFVLNGFVGGGKGARRVSFRMRIWVASISTSPVSILGLMASASRKRTLPTAATTYSGRTCSPLAWPSGISSLSSTIWLMPVRSLKSRKIRLP